MKKNILAIVFLFFLLVPNIAQRWKLKRYDAFFGIGTINMFTDLGVSNTESLLFGFRPDFTRPSVYFGARYKFSQAFSGKFSMAYGYGHSHDITNLRYEGGSGFRTNTHIIEPSVTGEYYLIKEQRAYTSAAIYNRRGMLNDYSTIGVYLYGGLGGVYFKPLHDINPRPSDIVKTNSGFTLALPVGLGLKYIYSDRIIIGYEIGPRYVFSDYLDGIKTASSKYNDIYWLTSIYLSYKIKTTRRNLPLFMDRKFKRALR
jgi:hypothetical protein